MDWVQLSRFHLKTQTEFSLRNVTVFKQKQEDVRTVSRNIIFIMDFVVGL
jgi:hypothetical protein